MLLEILYIIGAVLFVAAFGIPYVIEREKYKKMLNETEKKELLKNEKH